MPRLLLGELWAPEEENGEEYVEHLDVSWPSMPLASDLYRAMLKDYNRACALESEHSDDTLRRLWEDAAHDVEFGVSLR